MKTVHLISILTGVSSLVVGAQAANAQIRDFNIPAGDAVRTLPIFALQSGLQIVAPAETLYEYRTPALTGTVDAREALHRMIKGTDLVVHSNASGVVTLRQARTERKESPQRRGAIKVAQASGQQLSDAPGELRRVAGDAGEAAPDIVVVGSQIQGSKVTAALPVTVVDTSAIEATGATSGDELFRNIPQAGNVDFNAMYIATSSNSARGDVNSVNLRNLGLGNTLVLINGRRSVEHPTTQDMQFSFNTNAIPIAGVASIEVLRDGAGAIYGSDAVAGVVNTILRNDFKGAQVEFQYGGAPGTHLREGRLVALLGTDLQQGRGNLTVFASFDRKTAPLYTDFPFMLTDKRPVFAGTDFANTPSLDGGSTYNPWGAFQTYPNIGTVTSNGVPVTGPTGIFHIAPKDFPSCGVEMSPGLCIDAGDPNNTTDRGLRTDTLATFRTTLIPETNRINLFAMPTFELSDDVTLYGELGYYRAYSYQDNANRGTLDINTNIITVPASSYYNPFGPKFLEDGSPNPNRLPGLNIPDEGLAVTFRRYGTVDTGSLSTKVMNQQYRLLGGLRGEKFGFNWDSALLYSEAYANDTYEAVSATQFVAATSLTTPDAYNPFNGGDLNNPRVGDTTPSSASALKSLLVPYSRKSRTTLTLWDFKVNRPDLLALPAGDLGIATGIEVRRHTYKDDRDPRADGTAPYYDVITGITSPSDIPAVSPSPDVEGKRTVMSAFMEFAVPVISPEMEIPFVNRFEGQIAGRYEHYTDVGDVAKPKVALAWDIVPGLRLRGSWAQNFKAPNLEQLNLSSVTRQLGRMDWYMCEADLRAGRISNFGQCIENHTTVDETFGNPNLKPETSTALSYGVVFQPRFIPPEFGQLTITADIWQVKQRGVVGTLGRENLNAIDYLLRMQGSASPDVERWDPTPKELGIFAGTGLPAVGEVRHRRLQLMNLDTRDTRGQDINILYNLRTNNVGNFSVNVNIAHLSKLYQAPPPQIQAVINAIESGILNSGTVVTGGADLIGQDGAPEWRGSATVSWNRSGLALSWFGNYIGKVYDTGLRRADGSFNELKPTLIHNVTASYTFEGDRWASGPLNGTRILVGARNLFDRAPPPASGGFLATVYNPIGRYLYVNLRKSF